MLRTRVLLVEDNATTRDLLRDALGAAGFRVVVAPTGEEALQSVNAVRPDVVVLDLGLPAMHGDEFVRRWRERDRLAKEIPILVISGRPDAQQVVAEMGVAGFIAKPFDVDYVVSCVSRIAPTRPPTPLAPDEPIRVGEAGTSMAGAVRVDVRPEHERPFVLEVQRTGRDPVAAELTAVELETLRTLLDVAGRQRPGGVEAD